MLVLKIWKGGRIMSGVVGIINCALGRWTAFDSIVWVWNDQDTLALLGLMEPMAMCYVIY